MYTYMILDHSSYSHTHTHEGHSKIASLFDDVLYVHVGVYS